MATRFIILLSVCILPSTLLFTTVCGIINPLKLVEGITAKCQPAILQCQCGRTRNFVEIEIEQCSYIHRFKRKCKPCNGITVEDICPRFLRCSQCYPDGKDQCLACPEKKYGQWCEIDCPCKNGGRCNINGKCLCPEGFEGLNCEVRKGCLPPKNIILPLKANINSPEIPINIVYSCDVDYHLKGAALATCLPNGEWSTPAPKCVKKCPLLSAPGDGHLVFNGSELIEGVTAEFSCDSDHRLIGDKKLTCLSNGIWSSSQPHCDELAFCPDPGRVEYAKRRFPNKPSKQSNLMAFPEDSIISFECRTGFLQMGESTMTCLHNSQWSSEKPICIKASTIIPNCTTTGSDIVQEIGIPVRIFCPPECLSVNSKIWGTSIYRIESAVCRAAIHAGKITNSGGLVAVINNGEYTSFAGSNINNIQSQSYDSTDDSFRFDKLPPLLTGKNNENDCPEDLIKLQDTCILISSYPTTEKKAKAICKNLGLFMAWPKSFEDQNKLKVLLEKKGVNQIWTGVMAHETDMISMDYNDTIFEDIQNSTEIIDQVASSGPKCETMKTLESKSSSGSQFASRPEDCNSDVYFFCGHNSKVLASCEDPGDILNGEMKPIGRIGDAFYVGSSIEYNCDTLYYMEGVPKISCRGNGTWSDDKPTCVKVDTCEEQPVPIGGFVNYLPPLDTPQAQRIAIARNGNPGLRMARLPMGLSARPSDFNMIQTTTTPRPEMSIELPPGHYRVGSRAMYDCESRYYRLVGSRARRCQEGGKWSGRPPTCMPICGRSDSPRTPFIVNGNVTDIGQWPWQAGLARYIPDYNRWFLLCGGALLTERWVITAAHCITYTGTTLPIDPDKFLVYLGKYHRSDSSDDEYIQKKKILEIHIHPDYDPGIFDADIALIQLESPVQLNSRVQPVCLPTEQTTQRNLKSGTKGVVTGWGMNENETYSDTLQQAVLPVVSNEECEKGYADSDLPLTVTENMFCAGFSRGKYDACSGDSGGPIVFADESSKERRWILEGIVSWGSPQGCGNKNQYGGYTAVGKFLNWIHLFF